MNARRIELVLKKCLKLATHISISDDHVNAFMYCLNEFEHQFKGLTIDFGSMKVKENKVTNKGKKVLSPPHYLREMKTLIK